MGKAAGRLLLTGCCGIWCSRCSGWFGPAGESYLGAAVDPLRLVRGGQQVRGKIAEYGYADSSATPLGYWALVAVATNDCQQPSADLDFGSQDNSPTCLLVKIHDPWTGGRLHPRGFGNPAQSLPLQHRLHSFGQA